MVVVAGFVIIVLLSAVLGLMWDYLRPGGRPALLPNGRARARAVARARYFHDVGDSSNA